MPESFGPRCQTCGGYQAGSQHHDPGGLTPARWHRFIAGLPKMPDDQCYCNGAMSGGLPLPHPRGLPGCKYALDRPHIPGTDYYDGRDGSIEAEDDDEDRIAAEDADMRANREGDPAWNGAFDKW